MRVLARLDEASYRPRELFRDLAMGDHPIVWSHCLGQGRVFYQALGHHESIYYNNPDMLAHILAGMQYVLGDLKADDTPSRKKS